MTTALPQRGTIEVMYAGLARTVLAAIVPYLDRATTHLLAEHIRAGYPIYT